jgi:hypothetical protein
MKIAAGTMLLPGILPAALGCVDPFNVPSDAPPRPAPSADGSEPAPARDAGRPTPDADGPLRAVNPGPEIVDYTPDNAMPGERIRIVGRNLTGDSLRVTDARGMPASFSPAGVTRWLGQTLDAIELVVPAGWQSGPLTVSNGKGAFRGRVFNLGRNLAPAAVGSASSEYGNGWTIARAIDNDLSTSWFASAGDCLSLGPPACRSAPWFLVSFPLPQTVSRVAIRANREYLTGYNFLRGTIQILTASGTILWSGSFDFPSNERDLDVLLPTPIARASSVRFQGEKDEGRGPGLAEIEVFGP